jgi:hypothetical protein
MNLLKSLVMGSFLTLSFLCQVASASGPWRPGGTGKLSNNKVLSAIRHGIDGHQGSNAWAPKCSYNVKTGRQVAIERLCLFFDAGTLHHEVSLRLKNGTEYNCMIGAMDMISENQALLYLGYGPGQCEFGDHLRASVIEEFGTYFLRKVVGNNFSASDFKRQSYY